MSSACMFVGKHETGTKKIAVVTGGARGIGGELTKKLAEEKTTVYVIDRNKEGLDEIKRLHPDYVIPIEADLSTKEGIDKIVKKLEGVKVNYLVNNAGIVGVKYLKDFQFEDFARIFNTNITAPTLLITRLLPAFTKDARIVNVGSPAAFNFLPGLGPYSMTKAAINILSEIAKKELFKDGNILIDSFVPGEVDTGMQAQLRDFPEIGESFTQAKREGSLISPTLSAQWFAWLLLKATPDEFNSAKTVYNPVHYPRWLKEGQKVTAPPAFTKASESVPVDAQAKKRGV